MLSDVCLLRTSGISWEQWLGHDFQGQKVKGHQTALHTVALTHQAAAAVTVGMYWDHGNLLLCCGLLAWSAQRREVLRRPQREPYRGSRLPTAYYYYSRTGRTMYRFLQFRTIGQTCHRAGVATPRTVITNKIRLLLSSSSFNINIIFIVKR